MNDWVYNVHRVGHGYGKTIVFVRVRGSVGGCVLHTEHFDTVKDAFAWIARDRKIHSSVDKMDL